MAEEKQQEEVKKEDISVEETSEETTEVAPEKSELDLANERADEFRSQDLGKAILPSLDNLERALAVEGLTDDVRKGLEMVQESLIAALKDEGIEEVPIDGEFDHNFHMAIQTVPADDDHPAGSIAQVFQKGYKLHERLLRPAMVVVAE